LLSAGPAAGAEPAQPPAAESSASDEKNGEPRATEKKGEEPIEVVVRARPSSRGQTEGRASTKVDRRDMQERLPRSAPDALRYEPGVYVQQSAHGQGSPYIRGRTGQQTIVLFDGIRMNTSTWRQGPNQYFFTVDSKSLRSIEVTRGGASTFYGSDAVAGAIDAAPLEPRLLLGEGFSARPRALLQIASADGELANRFQIDSQFTENARLLVGAGVRRAGRLESGGEVRSPFTGALPQVPALESDGRTQLGTGYRELTADARFVARLSPSTRVTAAAYVYRQFDSPRTDQCPPPFAPRDECLKYDEQFRSLAYAAIEGNLGPAAESARAVASYQRQHERRTLDRPGSFIKNGGRDDVDTAGLSLKVKSAAVGLGAAGSLLVFWGGDVYADFVDSAAWTEFTDIDAVIPLSRGQYIAGSRYLQGGVFASAEAALFERLHIGAGVRGGGALAEAPEDAASGTVPVDRSFTAVVGHAGARLRVIPQLSALVHYDRSFRAPNLDDMTSRQQTGPGFQFENAALEPESADTFEAGLRLDLPAVEADLWVYRSIVHGAVARSFRAIGDCPPETPQCGTSWSRFQLVNAGGSSIIDGVEVWGRAFLPFDLSLRATLAYAYGEGPNPQPPPKDASLPYEERVPLSRVPPLNGTAELRWDAPSRLYLGAGIRWAALQNRLAPTDRSDARIPEGGTPGYAVLDLRAGLRVHRELVVSAVFENVFDAAYRVHGSSVNGPGRGVLFAVEAGP
jgi:iron complex outermembrane receptor protein/hemoglobin/transferrin/lactoferrin receptor protein